MYHAQYLSFMERARTELLNSLGIDLAALAALGVRRISFGSSLYRAALARAVAIVDAVPAGWDALADADALPYGTLAALMTR